jgi:hypothetical protein
MSTVTISHDRLIELAIRDMQQKGMTRIKADHLPGYTRPDAIQNYIPDATAYHGSQKVVVEAESREGLDLTHTSEQLSAFCSAAQSKGGYFIVVVNAADERSARLLLDSVGANNATTYLWKY